MTGQASAGGPELCNPNGKDTLKNKALAEMERLNGFDQSIEYSLNSVISICVY